MTTKNEIDCIKRVLNFSSLGNADRFDNAKFDGSNFLSTLDTKSPKLIALLENIKKIDKVDYIKHNKLFKHFIYSNVDRGYGAKIIATALIASGYTPIFKQFKNEIIVDNALVKEKNESKFALLSTVPLWKSKVTLKTIKSVLTLFNERPNNIYGENCRFIILDNGFKEGVDLFDVKYCHIFEDQFTQSDLIQATGRGLRFKGQCGLPFNKGWVLNVFNYSSSSRDTDNVMKQLKKKNPKIFFNETLQNSLLDNLKTNSVDYYLNGSNEKPKEFRIINYIVSGIKKLSPF